MFFIYVDVIDEFLRKFNILLVMLLYILFYIFVIGNEEDYLLEIECIWYDFDLVVFCIYYFCFECGIWFDLLKKYGYFMIIGVSVY